MRILIASDVHLLLQRKANFTNESSARREVYSRQVLEDILRTERDYAVCCGDFFDKFSNTETGILECAPIARQFDAILGGNHDHSSREDVRGSLDVLAGLLPGVVVSGAVERRDVENVSMLFVPHFLTQDLFEAALDEAVEKVKDATGWRLLFLHASYDSPFSENLSSLNLTESKAVELLGAFHHVFLGHEHSYRDLFENRLHVVGSHLPVSYDEMGDHRHFVFDSMAGSLESITHWLAEDHVFIGRDSDAVPGKRFYDLTECIDARVPGRLFKAGALAVRVRSEKRAEGGEAVSEHKIQSLPQQIEALIKEKHPDLLKDWQAVRLAVDVSLREG